jgi:nucleotide-binding universal stress UspA family protein
MKFLVPVNASTPELAPIEHVESVARRGTEAEVLLLNVQPAFNRRVSRFTSRADRNAFRAERSRAAMAGVIERFAHSRIPFRAVMVIGDPAERIAELAEAERVDEILIGELRRPHWLRWLMPAPAEAIAACTDIPVTVVARGKKETALERYLVPGMAGLAALAALFLSAE